MSRIWKAKINRRTLLTSASGAVIAPMMARAVRANASVRDIELSAAVGRWPLVGRQRPNTVV